MAPTEPIPPGAAPGGWRRFGRYARALGAPVLVWLLLAYALFEPIETWLHGEEAYEVGALQEWLEETRHPNQTLADMAEDYLRRAKTYTQRQQAAAKDKAREGDFTPADLALARQQVSVKREEFYQHLRALGDPPTKVYPGQLLLFPIIYRLEVHFDFSSLPAAQGARVGEKGPWLDAPVVWASGLPARDGQFQKRRFKIHALATVEVHYQLRAYNKRQRQAQEVSGRLQQLGLLAVGATGLGLAWLLLLQGREREQERERLRAQRQTDRAERLLLEEERKRTDAERQLLQQRLATQDAERKNLELKSHLFASIGIMAGSYAHNIKNLLVRPNDLLRRCLEADGAAGEQAPMLREVQQTLGTVTERLQEILRTVRRDPTQSEAKRLDLNAVLTALARTWQELAGDRWKLDLVLEPADGPLPVAGDPSHLQQALENLLFNARDATFEMRSHLREAARRAEPKDPAARKQAVLAAAAWRGRVVLRARAEGGHAVLEMADNGIGMTEEVRRRCTETHFSTKRDNALFEGQGAGMGLGLSFVVAILEHHRAALEVESEPLRGATFRVRFPLEGVGG